MHHVTELRTRGGLKILVRPASLGDDSTLNELYHHVSPEDLRFRFLSGAKEVSQSQIDLMTHVDHKSAETYIAFISGSDIPVATAMLASDTSGTRGEVAISVRQEDKGRGIGWSLLSFLADKARERGLEVIESIESRANHDALAVEKDFGFETSPMPDDPSVLVLRKALGPPAIGIP